MWIECIFLIEGNTAQTPPPAADLPQPPKQGETVRLDGHTASIYPQAFGTVVETQDDRQETVCFTRLADRHIRPGWVRTIHSAQGATADRVMAHLETFRANTVDAPAVYVAISRAKDTVALYTDNRAQLTEALGLRDGAQIGAIDEAWWEVEVGMG